MDLALDIWTSWHSVGFSCYMASAVKMVANLAWLDIPIQGEYIFRINCKQLIFVSTYLLPRHLGT